jgi:hypothetical protein
LSATAKDWDLVRLYGFGTQTCDFLLCGEGGMFIAAILDASEVSLRAVFNVNCLNDRSRFSEMPSVHDFDGEVLEARSVRR